MSREKLSELAEVAQSLEAELRRFDDAADEVKTIRLDSKKNLDRAVRAIQRAAEIEGRLAEHVGGLVQGIRAAHERQQRAGDRLAAFGRELQERQVHYQALIEGFDGFAQQAASLNELLQTGPDALPLVKERITALAAQAGALAADAEAKGFRDLAKDATARQEQLEAALLRLGRVPTAES